MLDGARELARRSPHLAHAANCSGHVDPIKVIQLAGNELQHLLHIRYMSGKAGESMGGMQAWRAWDAGMNADSREQRILLKASAFESTGIF